MHIIASVSIAGHSAGIECILVSFYTLQSSFEHNVEASDADLRTWL